jgi:hypothetical protein
MVLLGLPVSVWPDINYFAPLRTASVLQDGGTGLWTVAQTRSTYIFPTGNAERTHLFEATLYAGLPVPTVETPLDEILTFREARYAELLRLRHAIDRLQLAVTEAEDTRRALEFARNDLALSIEDLHKALGASAIRTFFSTLRLYLNLPEAKIATTLLTAFGAERFGLPLEVAAGVGLGANVALTFATRVLDRPVALPLELKDFIYLYDVHKYWATAERV